MDDDGRVVEEVRVMDDDFEGVWPMGQTEKAWCMTDEPNCCLSQHVGKYFSAHVLAYLICYSIHKPIKEIAYYLQVYRH